MSSLYLGMQDVHTSLASVLTTLAEPLAPPLLVGVLHQPDGSPAGPLQVEFNPATLKFAAPIETVRTDATGAFRLPLPKGMPLPADSRLALQVNGANAALTVSLPSARVAANGLVGAVVLPDFLAPLPVSILAALEALVPPAPATRRRPHRPPRPRSPS